MPSRRAGGDGAEDVLDVEAAAQARRAPRARPTRKLVADGRQLEAFGPDVGVVVEAEGERVRLPRPRSSSASRRPYGSPTLTAAGGRLPSTSGLDEEPALRLEVRVHRPVEVEVVLRSGS